MCRCSILSFIAVLFANLACRIFDECLLAVCRKRRGCDAESSDHDEIYSSEISYLIVTRERAEELLDGEQNGTFIVRPSACSDDVAVLSVIQDDRIFHVRIRRIPDGRLALGVEKPNEKTFSDLNALINYYISNYLILRSDEDGTRSYALLLPYCAT